jgi:hypothetical protein
MENTQGGQFFSKCLRRRIYFALRAEFFVYILVLVTWKQNALCVLQLLFCILGFALVRWCVIIYWLSLSAIGGLRQ